MNDEPAVKGLVALALRVAMAFTGKVYMDPHKIACDEAEKMVAELKRRGWDPGER